MHQRGAQVTAEEGQIERFLDHLWVEFGLSENTITAYRADIKTVQSFLSSRNTALADACDADLLSYMSARF